MIERLIKEPNSLAYASFETSDRSGLKSGESILDGELPQELTWGEKPAPISDGVTGDLIPASADSLWENNKVKPKKDKTGTEKNIQEKDLSEPRTHPSGPGGATGG